MTAIGKVSACEKYPATVDEFYFWVQDDTIVRPFDIVKVEHYYDSVTYGVVEEITHITDGSGHIASYVSSDFGDVTSDPTTLRLGLSFIKCGVLSNHSRNPEYPEQIYMPVQNGKSVFFAKEEEIVEALGLRDIPPEKSIPAGFIETSSTTVPISLNKDFLIGPEGAHLNISGISGLATKTSYAMFLLQALQQKQDDVAIIALNVKKDDLLRLDEENPKISQTVSDYIKAGLEGKPFENVKYFYPFQDSRGKTFSSNTYLSEQALEQQYNQDKAFNYIYTYEKDRENLELLFSNIDDPNQTMESILNEIMENSDFEGLMWNSFLDELKEYTQKGHSKGKEITIASWRKFLRLIRKSIKHDIFQRCLGAKSKRQCRLRENIYNIKSNEMYVIDIAKLDEQLQCFVFGDIVKSVYNLKLGGINQDDDDFPDRDDADIPKHIVIFVDELNKYAASSLPKHSPILNALLEITERGRSMGIVLFSAEQFKSSIHDRVKGNCSTHVYGRTNAIEISKSDYRFIPKVFTNMMTRLGKGDLILEHPIFRSLLKVKFPFPSYHQGQE